jgi:hypothetical protein
MRRRFICGGRGDRRHQFRHFARIDVAGPGNGRLPAASIATAAASRVMAQSA